MKPADRNPYVQFTPEENDRLRAVLRDVMARRALSGAAVARRMGLSSNTVASFLRGVNGAGEAVVRGIEDVTGQTRDQILGRDPRPGVRLDTLPGWPAAVASAQRLFPGEATPEAYRAVGAWVLPEAPRLDPLQVHLLARAYLLGPAAVLTDAPIIPN